MNLERYPLKSAGHYARVRSLTCVESIKEMYDIFGESYLAKAYIEMLADLSNVISCIQNGYGKIVRLEEENPKGVLEELREEITSERLYKYVEMLPFIQKSEDVIAEFYKVGCAFKEEER